MHSNYIFFKKKKKKKKNEHGYYHIKERKNRGGPISSSTIHDHKFKFQMKKHTNISSYNDKKELQKLQS